VWGRSFPALVSRLSLCRHGGIMRCRGMGSNAGRADSGGEWRNWEELARPAKPAGLAKGSKDVRSCRRGRPRKVCGAAEVAGLPVQAGGPNGPARSVASTGSRGAEDLRGRTPRQNPGGGTKPGGGVGHGHGGGALLPDPQHRRHPHPVAGNSVAAAIRARRSRRTNMVSLRLGYEIRTPHTRGVLISREDRPWRALPGGVRPAGLRAVARPALWTYNSKAACPARHARLQRNANDFRGSRVVVTVPTDRPMREPGEALRATRVARP